MSYATIYADPPWLERGGGKIKRGADKHYPLMKKEDILRTMLQAQYWNTREDLYREELVFDPAENAHLYLWVTNNHLPDGLWVMAGLGFRYITNVVWNKTGRFGLGQYFRGKHELLLFGVRGRGTQVRTDAKDIPSSFEAPVGRHSAKPKKVYKMIEKRSDGPYLEMFARNKRKGWDSWGNEV